MTTKEVKLKEQIKLLRKEVMRYKKAFYTMHDYFDSIADEEKLKVDKILTKLGL
jgi:hypothetical protein